MARDPNAPPEEFVAFVERRGTGLRLAAHALTGNDRLAEALVHDLLAAIALRWRRLTRADEGVSRAGAADAYLERIFRRESAGWQRDRADPGAPQADLRLLRLGAQSPAAARLPGQLTAEVARRAWESARRTRRRWGLVAAGVAGVLLVTLAAPRGRPEPAVEADQPPASPSALPEWVQILPTRAEQARLPALDTPFPARITLAESVPLSGRGVHRALALFLPANGGPLVLGDDGVMRDIDAPLTADIRLPGRPGVTPMTASSLAPDGTQAAFIHDSGVAVVDLRTGVARDIAMRARIVDIAWLTPQTLLAAGPRATLTIDLRTGAATPTLVDARYALTRHTASLDPPPPSPSPGTSPPSGNIGLPAELVAQVVELLPVGEPATAPARLRRYLPAGPTMTATLTPVAGDRTGWIGPWVGPGFVAGRRAARDCDARDLPMPPPRDQAVNATIVLDANTAAVQRALVAPRDSTTLAGPKLLGWLDRDTVLVLTSNTSTERLLAWRVTTGELSRVAEIDGPALVSVADLTLPN